MSVRELKLLGHGMMILYSLFNRSTDLRYKPLVSDFNHDKLQDHARAFRSWLEQFNPEGIEFRIEYHAKFSCDDTIGYWPDYVDADIRVIEYGNYNYHVGDSIVMGMTNVSIILLVDETDLIRFKLAGGIDFGVDVLKLSSTMLLNTDGSYPRNPDGSFKRGF